MTLNTVTSPQWFLTYKRALKEKWHVILTSDHIDKIFEPEGQYIVIGRYWFFESQADAIAFKLRYC